MNTVKNGTGRITIVDVMKLTALDDDIYRLQK